MYYGVDFEAKHEIPASGIYAESKNQMWAQLFPFIGPDVVIWGVPMFFRLTWKTCGLATAFCIALAPTISHT